HLLRVERALVVIGPGLCETEAARGALAEGAGIECAVVRHRVVSGRVLIGPGDAVADLDRDRLGREREVLDRDAARVRGEADRRRPGAVRLRRRLPLRVLRGRVNPRVADGLAVDGGQGANLRVPDGAV